MVTLGAPGGRKAAQPALETAASRASGLSAEGGGAAFGGHERVTDQQRLVGLLEGLRARRALLSVRVDDREAAYNTALLKIDAAQRVIYLDELVPAEGHERVHAGSTLRVAGMLNRLPTHFLTLILGVGVHGGIAYYRATLPERLDYRQRRAFFRAHVPRGHSIAVELTPPEGEAFTGRLIDISQGGLAVTLPRVMPVQAMDTLEVRALELPGQKPFGCKLQVRYTRADRDEPAMRVGMRFLDLDVRAQRALVRAVMGFEREWIRKRGKSPGIA